jgi:hypothetical protein
VLFAILALRQLQIALIDAPRLADDPRNPRVADIAANRGTIVASDGTPLAFTRDGKRIYPEGPLTAHVVGYASPRYGTSGIEDSFDRVLSAPRSDRGPLDEFWSLLTDRDSAPHGDEVVTTLDLRVQSALVAGLRGYGRAAGVALDPRTGAVLAMAAVPAFDPNHLEHDWPALIADSASPLLDRATNGLYPPGSTFKIVTASDGLAAGLVTPATIFHDTGGLPVGNFTVRNDQNEVTGTQTLTGAFALSSNVDFAALALQIGVDRWFADAAQWGLGAPMEFDLPTAADRLPPRAEVTPSVRPGLVARHAAADGARGRDDRRRRPHAAPVPRAQHRGRPDASRHARGSAGDPDRPRGRRRGARYDGRRRRARHRDGRGAAGRHRGREDRDRHQSARPRALVVRVFRTGRRAARRGRRDRGERGLRRGHRGSDRTRRPTGRARPNANVDGNVGTRTRLQRPLSRR